MAERQAWGHVDQVIYGQALCMSQPTLEHIAELHPAPDSEGIGIYDHLPNVAFGFRGDREPWRRRIARSGSSIAFLRGGGRGVAIILLLVIPCPLTPDR